MKNTEFLNQKQYNNMDILEKVSHRENFFMTLYRNSNFLSELKRPNDPACFDEYWRYYFILSHLTDIYGSGIHGKAARAWGNPDKTKNIHSTLEAKDFNAEEIICATYSSIVNEDLGWLFRIADFNVPDGLYEVIP